MELVMSVFQNNNILANLRTVMNSKLQGLPRGEMLSLCQSFLRLPVTKQVRKKCHCCILAEDKMLLLVQHKFLWYSIFGGNLWQIKHLERTTKLKERKELKELLLSSFLLWGTVPEQYHIEKCSKESNKKCLEITEGSSLFHYQSRPNAKVFSVTSTPW